MGAIKFLVTLGITILSVLDLTSQQLTIPAGASALLQETASDVSQLLSRAQQTRTVTVVRGNPGTSRGWVFQYDTSITDNRICYVTTSGNQIVFRAAEDYGLIYGVYRYLHRLGFRFYQPGTIWEKIPVLADAWQPADTLIRQQFQYQSWFLSGGYNRWIMDAATQYDWDRYPGNSGHAWALYQRRNGMAGAYRFAGHRGDIMTDQFLQPFRDNPCLVAPYNGSRTADVQSVPDVNQPAAMNLWADELIGRYRQYEQTIKNNPAIYPDLLRRFRQEQGLIGIEVPDGAHWANSTVNSGCNQGTLLSETDQQFTLANYTARAVQQFRPGLRSQIYAYDAHAGIPAAAIGVHPTLDVQVIPTAFQFETSAKALMNRWYQAHNAVSEYHYLNIAQWSGEAPAFYLTDFTQTLARIRQKNSQGIVWESGASKFATMPYLYAASGYLQQGASISAGIDEFSGLFGAASNTIRELLVAWTSESMLSLLQGIQDNKFRLPYYWSLLEKASGQAGTADALVRARIGELKAFMHYLQLYYNWLADQRPVAAKQEAAGRLCIYLARIQHLQLVNSYAVISTLVAPFNADSDFYRAFNPQNGLAYQAGQLAPLSSDEIEADFIRDLAFARTEPISFQQATSTSLYSDLQRAGLKVPEQLNWTISYTNGKNYTQRSEYRILAKAQQPLQIDWNAQHEMPGKGVLNFAVENCNDPAQIITDYTIRQDAASGRLNIYFPTDGTYRLVITSRNKVTVQVNLALNGNVLYKADGNWGNTVENYRSNLSSFPGYVYVPAGVERVYFSLNNNNPAGAGFASATAIARAFLFKDVHGEDILPQFSATDSSMMYLDLGNHSGTWFTATKMEQYRLTLINISNNYWYLRTAGCAGTAVKARFLSVDGVCRVQLEAAATSGNPTWELYFQGLSNRLAAADQIVVPERMGPSTMVWVYFPGGCTEKYRLSDIAGYFQGLNACTGAAQTPVPAEEGLKIYPNPGAGTYFLSSGTTPVVADKAEIFNSNGVLVYQASRISRIDISNQPAGIYMYRVYRSGKWDTGRIIKR